MSNGERFPSEVAEILRKCGWYPGRHVGDQTLEVWQKVRLISDGLEMPGAARVVLEEFGGLTIVPRGRGVDFARLALEFDPSEGHRGQVLQSYVETAGVEGLYPLGTYGDYDGTFLIEPCGAVYVDYRLDSPAGKNIDQAMVKLLLGLRW